MPDSFCNPPATPRGNSLNFISLHGRSNRYHETNCRTYYMCRNPVGRVSSAARGAWPAFLRTIFAVISARRHAELRAIRAQRYTRILVGDGEVQLGCNATSPDGEVGCGRGRKIVTAVPVQRQPRCARLRCARRMLRCGTRCPVGSGCIRSLTGAGILGNRGSGAGSARWVQLTQQCPPCPTVPRHAKIARAATSVRRRSQQRRQRE